MKKKNRIRLFFVLVVFAFIGLGYSMVNSSLEFIGDGRISKASWDVHFTNLSNINKIGTVDDSSTGLYAANIDSNDNKIVSFSILLNNLGDKYIFNVDVKNYGTLPAKANMSISGLDSNVRDYITYTVTGIGENEVIEPLQSKTLTITIELKSNIEYLPSEPISANIVTTVNAVQN